MIYLTLLIPIILIIQIIILTNIYSIAKYNVSMEKYIRDGVERQLEVFVAQRTGKNKEV